MRDKWYTDNRDLVKWGVLLTLAERHSVRHILQVLYYRPTEWPELEVDGERVAIPDAVLRHFRRAEAVTEIDAPAQIEVISERFENRAAYFGSVVDRIRRRPKGPGIVFLDPDTGLAPQNPSLDHILDTELYTLWTELRLDDLLVFYQHQTNRNGQPWVEPKRAQFERAIGLLSGRAKLARAEGIARDVVFFYARKSGEM